MPKQSTPESTACGDAKGTVAGNSRHARANEPPCDDCRAAKSEYEAARRGPSSSDSGFGRNVVVECGTNAGYQKHRRDNEEACDPCKAAAAEYRRQYRKNKRKKSAA